MKLLNSKKAEVHFGFLSFYIFVFFFVSLAMGLVLYFSANEYLSGYLAHTPDLNNRVYAYRAINVCIAYQDQNISRYYPGIIDYTKYNQETLDKCYSDTSIKSFNIKLVDLNKKEEYEKINIGFGASLRTLSYPVLIKYEDGTLNQGLIYFGVSDDD